MGVVLQRGLPVKLDVIPKGAMRSVLCSTKVKGELRVETNCADVRAAPKAGMEAEAIGNCFNGNSIG